MADEPRTKEERTKEEVTEEELEAQEAEELPDRETMMILDPGPDAGITPFPWPESEAPDDRYEQ